MIVVCSFSTLFVDMCSGVHVSHRGEPPARCKAAAIAAPLAPCLLGLWTWLLPTLHFQEHRVLFCLTKETSEAGGVWHTDGTEQAGGHREKEEN